MINISKLLTCDESAETLFKSNNWLRLHEKHLRRCILNKHHKKIIKLFNIAKERNEIKQKIIDKYSHIYKDSSKEKNKQEKVFVVDSIDSSIYFRGTT